MPVINRISPQHSFSLRIISRILLITFALLLLVSFFYTLTLNTLFQIRPPFQCPRTLIYPFDEGCPYNCSAVRQRSQQGPYYKTSIVWKFGELAEFRNKSALPDSAFHAQTALAETFYELDDHLRDEVRRQVDADSLKPLTEQLETRMDVTLSYLCCLTKDEADKVVTVAKDWNTTRNFDLRLRFDRMECYHEQDNLVIVTFEVDEKSERELMRINRGLRDTLELKGVRVWVERERQIRFHTSVTAFRTGDGGSIESYLGAIWRAVRDVDGASAKTEIQFRPTLGEVTLSRGS